MKTWNCPHLWSMKSSWIWQCYKSFKRENHFQIYYTFTNVWSRIAMQNCNLKTNIFYSAALSCPVIYVYLTVCMCSEAGGEIIMQNSCRTQARSHPLVTLIYTSPASHLLALTSLIFALLCWIWKFIGRQKYYIWN